ncbi:hypothetical protein H920_10491 [Fukomys damarensis]|uniref:Uncharacterized protein n=1 Tax=Fukomys damarensis TaxID=885580 RepID=A0A091DAL7_FUKDA|nr:hypothetical protein H920_10491 [Fukomys damarensis]
MTHNLQLTEKHGQGSDFSSLTSQAAAAEDNTALRVAPSTHSVLPRDSRGSGLRKERSVPLTAVAPQYCGATLPNPPVTEAGQQQPHSEGPRPRWSSPSHRFSPGHPRQEHHEPGTSPSARDMKAQRPCRPAGFLQGSLEGAAGLLGYVVSMMEDNAVSVPGDTSDVSPPGSCSHGQISKCGQGTARGHVQTEMQCKSAVGSLGKPGHGEGNVQRRVPGQPDRFPRQRAQGRGERSHTIPLP